MPGRARAHVRVVKTLLPLLFLLVANVASAKPVAVKPLALKAAFFELSNASGVCKAGAQRSLVGHEPAASGRYPLFVYLTGTQMSYQGIEAQALTRAMAERGFVSVSVEYDNGAYAYCSGMQSKARCVFGKSDTESAVAKLCARANVDCEQGIVVSGFSQGANIAALSKNLEPRVRGAYLMGHGHKASNFMDSSSCQQASATALTADELRSINGEHDGFFGGSRERVRKQLELVTGAKCGDAVDCLQPAGTGFYVVQDAQLKDGTADHCYFLDAANGYCSKFKGLDAVWLSGDEAWSMPTNLNWLAGRVRH